MIQVNRLMQSIFASRTLYHTVVFTPKYLSSVQDIDRIITNIPILQMERLRLELT